MGVSTIGKAIIVFIIVFSLVFATTNFFLAIPTYMSLFFESHVLLLDAANNNYLPADSITASKQNLSRIGIVRNNLSSLEITGTSQGEPIQRGDTVRVKVKFAFPFEFRYALGERILYIPMEIENETRALRYVKELPPPSYLRY